MNHVTIVPPEKGGAGAMMAQGTKVLTADGQEITGVTKVVLSAAVGELWEAVVHLHPRVVPIAAVCVEYVDGLSSLPAWRLWLLKLAGFKVARDPSAKPLGTMIFDTTTVTDDSRKFRGA